MGLDAVGQDNAVLVTTDALPASMQSAGRNQTWGATGLAAGNATSPSFRSYGSFNISLYGTFSATIQLQRSFDNGMTWLPVSGDTAGDALQWTAPVSLTWPEIEREVLYQLKATSYASGTVNFRLSQSPFVVGPANYWFGLQNPPY